LRLRQRTQSGDAVGVRLGLRDVEITFSGKCEFEALGWVEWSFGKSDQFGYENQTGRLSGPIGEGAS
jgi:hypothetical protein